MPADIGGVKQEENQHTKSENLLHHHIYQYRQVDVFFFFFFEVLCIYDHEM
jgi:hypothetical protein